MRGRLAARCARLGLRFSRRAFEQLRRSGEIIEVALGALHLGLHAAPFGERGVLAFRPVERLVVRHAARAGAHRRGRGKHQCGALAPALAATAEVGELASNAPTTPAEAVPRLTGDRGQLGAGPELGTGSRTRFLDRGAGTRPAAG
jgi:hypothetical protein